VIDVLSDLFVLRGAPQHVRSDNGPEFVAAPLQRCPAAWLARLQTASARGLRARHRRAGDCATQPSVARASPQPNRQLTCDLDHSVGADQRLVKL
jgi:hypothetical protein